MHVRLHTHMHAEYEHELMFRAKRSCAEEYRVASIAPFFKSHPDTMHLRCISKCTITANCTYAFAQNVKDGIKSGKCQLFTRCDKYRSEARRGRLFILRPKTTTKSTTTTSTTTTTKVEDTTTLAGNVTRLRACCFCSVYYTQSARWNS